MQRGMKLLGTMMLLIKVILIMKLARALYGLNIVINDLPSWLSWTSNGNTVSKNLPTTTYRSNNI